MSGSAQNLRDASGRLDFLIGLVAVLAAVLAIVWLIPTQVEIPAVTDQLSPRLFPTLSAGVVGLFGLALMFRSRRWILEPGGHEGFRFVVEALAWVAWATVVMLLLSYAGFVITGAVSCFAGMLLAGQRRHLLWCALGSVLLPLAVQQLAWYAFYIQLP
jgi:hypothetical protein